MYTGSNMRALSAKLSLAVIPSALFGLSVLLTHVHGPYYLRNNFDPDYIYLLNSLSLLTWHSPAHTDHPGTTLQILGAAVIFFQWMGRSVLVHAQPLSDSVLSRPEEYLRGMNLILNVLISGTLYWAARSIYRLSHSLIAALLLQATLLVYLQTFLALPRVSPEPLLIAVGLLLMVPTATMVLTGEGREKNGSRLAFAAGAIFGFGLITKITFAPLAALILLFPGKFNKLRFIGAAITASVVCLLPVAGRIPAMASWLTSLLVHTGQYGAGPIGIPGLNVLVVNFLSLWRDELPLFLFLGLYATLLLLLPLFKRRGIPIADGTRPLLLAACIAIVAETLMVAKHPSTHYLLPVLVLSAFLNSALYAILPRPELNRATVRRQCLAVMVAFIGIGLVRSRSSLRWWMDAARTDRQNIAEVRALADSLTGCQVIGSYRSSLELYALSFASDYSAAVHRKTLETLYPGAIHYDPFSGRFLSFSLTENREAVKQLVASGQCVLMESTPLAATVLKQFLLTDGIYFSTLITGANPLSPTEATALYRLQPTRQP